MIDFVQYTVTCLTADCGNSGIPITLQAPAVDPHFVCGVCCQTITETMKENHGSI